MLKFPFSEVTPITRNERERVDLVITSETTGLGAIHQPRRLQMNVVRASAVQLSPVLYSREGTIEKVVRKIHELGQQGVQFATFPETVVPYYPYFSIVQSGYEILRGSEFLKLLNEAVTVPSLATEAISEACRQAEVVVSIGVNAARAQPRRGRQCLEARHLHRARLKPPGQATRRDAGRR